MLIAMPLITAHGINEEAYCETTGKWLTETKAFGPFQLINDEADWRAQMEAGDFGVLTKLSPVTDDMADGSAFTTLTMRHAEDPASTHLLSVDHVTMKLDKQGKADMKRKSILRNMMIDRETHDLIDETLGAMFPPPEAQADASGEQPDAPG
jgi:hypothetical protein